MQRGLVVLGIIMATLAYGAEAGLAWRAYNEYTNKLNNYWSTHIIDVIAQQRESGIAVYPTTSGHNVAALPDADRLLELNGTKVLPLASLSNATLVTDNEDGEMVLYRTDEMGFRNPAGSWSRNDIDVVTLGASFCRGIGWDGESIHDRLRELGYPVISGCVGGTGVIHSLAVFREYMAQRRPKLVLWMISPDLDLRELAFESNHPILSKYVADPAYRQNLAARRDEIEPRITQIFEQAIPLQIKAMAKVREDAARLPRLSLRNILVDSLLLRRIRTKLGLAYDMRSLPRPEPSDARPRAPIAQYRPLVEMLRDEVERAGSRLVVVYLPMAGEVRNGPTELDAAALAMYRSLDRVTTVDPTPDLRAVKGGESQLYTSYYMTRGAHFRHVANAAIGDAIARELERLGIPRKTAENKPR